MSVDAIIIAGREVQPIPVRDLLSLSVELGEEHRRAYIAEAEAARLPAADRVAGAVEALRRGRQTDSLVRLAFDSAGAARIIGMACRRCGIEYDDSMLSGMTPDQWTETALRLMFGGRAEGNSRGTGGNG